MTYLMLQMIGGMLISAGFGALLLWLGQVFWGRLVAPVRAKTLEYELEEARADLETQGSRMHGLEKELGGLTQASPGLLQEAGVVDRGPAQERLLLLRLAGGGGEHDLADPPFASCFAPSAIAGLRLVA